MVNIDTQYLGKQPKLPYKISALYTLDFTNISEERETPNYNSSQLVIAKRNIEILLRFQGNQEKQHDRFNESTSIAWILGSNKLGAYIETIRNIIIINIQYEQNLNIMKWYKNMNFQSL